MAKPAALDEIHRAVEVLGRLTEVFRQRRQELAASVGLTEQQWSVLDEIETERFMPSMFARRRESSAAAVSKILRQLQDKELVVVSLSASDGRQRLYELSPAGKRALAQLRKRREHAVDAVWQFDSAAVREFARFGNELTERLECYSKEQQHAGLDARKGPDHGKDTLRQGV